MNVVYSDENRIGDHIWWISDVRKFQAHYPGWSYNYDLRAILEQILSYCLFEWGSPRKSWV